MNTNEVRAKFDYWFGGRTLEESNKANTAETKPEKKELTERKMQTSTKQKCPKCKQSMVKCECENAKKADKNKAKSKSKNKMGAMPEAAKPNAAKNAAKNAALNAKKGKPAKKGKSHIKEGVAKVVYGIKEGQEIKRYAIEKADVASALATAKRMAKTKDLSTVSFIDVVDLKEGVVKTVYETLDNYKSRKRIFETHVLCSACGSGELLLSKHRTKVRCKRCGVEDLVENIDGVKKA